MKEAIKNFLQGGVLGISMIIPGVSGGTMALVMGIYERLLMAINRITPASFKELLPPYPDGVASKWRTACIKLDIYFLAMLTVGAVVVFGALTKVMPYMIQSHHEPTFGFFLGLILASVIIPLKLIKKVTWKVVVALCVGIAVTGYLGHRDNQRQHERIVAYDVLKSLPESDRAPTEHIQVTPGHLGYIGVSMGVAISACILPGVSGSLVLVILGVYAEILESISRLGKCVLSFDFGSILMADVLIVGSASLGGLVGLLTFARVMKFALNRFHDTTMGGLIGLMIGSLYVIWPFRESGTVLSRGKEKLAFGYPRLPEVNGEFWLTVVSAIIGIAVIVIMEVMEKNKEESSKSKV